MRKYKNICSNTGTPAKDDEMNRKTNFKILKNGTDKIQSMFAKEPQTHTI